jgi:radical SAM-linked protein
VAFSQGHHPLPRFSFGPALSLGADSEAEYLDIDLTEPADADDVRGRLNAEMPEGLSVLEAWLVPLRGTSIEGAIRAFRYRVELAPDVDVSGLDQAVGAFLAAEEFAIRKHARGGDRKVIARPYVTRLARVGERALELEILFGPRGTIKPGDLVSALTGAASSPPRVRKIDTIFHTGTELSRDAGADRTAATEVAGALG